MAIKSAEKDLLRKAYLPFADMDDPHVFGKRERQWGAPSSELACFESWLYSGDKTNFKAADRLAIRGICGACPQFAVCAEEVLFTHAPFKSAAGLKLTEQEKVKRELKSQLGEDFLIEMKKRPLDDPYRSMFFQTTELVFLAIGVQEMNYGEALESITEMQSEYLIGPVHGPSRPKATV